MNDMSDDRPRAGTPPVIACRNLSKVFEQGSRVLHVLTGVDLTVHRGDVVSIVGASGSRKSTLLHLLGGLDDIGVTLQQEDAIGRFEAERERSGPVTTSLS